MENEDVSFGPRKKVAKTFYLIPLKASGKKQKEHINEKWRLMINAKIEADF